MRTEPVVAPPRLVEHLLAWVGRWPPPSDGLTVVGNPRNAEPGWDGAVHPVTGVADERGAGVVGVPPAASAALVGRRWEVDELSAVLPATLGRPDLGVYQGVFRWTTDPTPLPDVGRWLPADDPAVPDWLRPFGGQVLVVLDGDAGYVAGLGLKRHGPASWEISVGTAEAARGRGLARRLVAQAARRVLALGAVPTYLHDPANLASARVADAAGFPDRGWAVFGAFPTAP